MQAVTKLTLGLFWRHSFKYKWQFYVIWFAIIATTVLYTYEPVVIRNLMDSLTPGTQPLSSTERFWLIVLIALAVSNQVIWRVVGFSHNSYQPRYISDLLVTCYQKLLGHSLPFFTNNFVGSLVARVRRFASAGETIDDKYKFDLFRVFVQWVCVQIFVFTTLSSHLEFGVVVFVWSVLYAGFAYWFSNYKLPFDIAVADQETKTTAHLADTLTNMIAILTFATRKYESRRFEGLADELARRRRKSWLLDQYVEIFQGGASLLLRYGLSGYALWCFKLGHLTPWDVMFVYMITGRISDPLWELGRNIRTVFQQLAHAEEATEDMAKEPDVVDIPDALVMSVPFGKIEFRNVSFGYSPETMVLRNFNLIIEPGTTVALVGHSGCGKSTIVNTLYRFWEIQDGQILIDDQDISSVSVDTLRRSMSLVPQEPTLFHRSLYDNIAYGFEEATMEHVVAASRAADCHEFIEDLPQGYDTKVGERGVKLSGGQRQRVALARALLADASILVLDEATSSLDSITERRVKNELARAFTGRTKLIIAHRLTTIKDADRIVVMGRDHTILEDGSHHQLMEKGGEYSRLYTQAIEQAVARATI